MSCEYCECFHCEEERDNAIRDAGLKELFESWNWNMSPAECAREIEMSSFQPDEIWVGMKEFGFSDDSIDATRDAYEVFCS